MSVASQLRERVRIERPVTTDDEYGGKTVIWEELATVFAQVNPVYAAITERVIGEQREANAGYRVLIRQRTDLTAAMRIVWKSHTLFIHSLHESGEILNILSYEENL